MAEKSSDEISKREFELIIGAYTDDELIKVLKKRNQYQQEAAQFAVQEAIRRKLIYSEQDLFAKAFNPEPERFSVFPTIENEKARTKYRKSITRFLIIIGIIPMVLGGIEIIDGQSLKGVLMVVFGAAWSIASYRLMRTSNMKLIYLIFLLLLILAVYIVVTFVSIRFVNAMDMVVAAVAVSLIFYLIGFLRKLSD